ncbi:MAG: FG-GAP repeat protein, partial [Phycisphaerales bacterium]|nr:FG-GAP repeat protein [Phycisphaerales bacterium]
MEKAVYVFHDDGVQFGEVAMFPSESPTGSDEFGSSVDIDNGVIVVGAPWASDNGSMSGAAFIFERPNGEWNRTQRLAADLGRPEDKFGYRVAILGDTLLVTAPGVDISEGHVGATYVFRRFNEEWREVGFAHNGATTGTGGFSEAVAIWNDTAIVGSGYDPS